MRIAVLAGIMLVLPACSQMGTIETRTPVTTDLKRFTAVGVTVGSKTKASSTDLERLERQIVERLESSGRFREVTAQADMLGATAGLLLAVEVLTLPEGGFWDRSWFGEGEAKFEVTLSDRASGQAIGVCVVEGKASRGVLWSSASGRALDEAVDEVVECVTRP